MKHFISIFVLFIVAISLLQAQDTVKVITGWNMIGALSTTSLDQFRSEPIGIITSSYFGYSPGGYSAKDTLNKGFGYWVRASQAGILIGETSSGTSCGEVVIYDGRGYNTIKIGSQCWFQQNLSVGIMISGSAVQSNNKIIEKYCYDGDEANCNTYGALYQWDEAMQYSTIAGARGICPTGWHIPTYGELQILGTTVNNNNSNALKAVGQGKAEGAGTNTSGFSALLSGIRNYYGSFVSMGDNTYFWSSTENDASFANYMYLYNNGSNIYFLNNYKSYCFSVRCLKD